MLAGNHSHHSIKIVVVILLFVKFDGIITEPTVITARVSATRCHCGFPRVAHIGMADAPSRSFPKKKRRRGLVREPYGYAS